MLYEEIVRYVDRSEKWRLLALTFCDEPYASLATLAYAKSPSRGIGVTLGESFEQEAAERGPEWAAATILERADEAATRY